MNSTKIGIALNQKRKILNHLCAGVGSKRHLFGWFKSKGADEVGFHIGALSLALLRPSINIKLKSVVRKSQKVDWLKYLLKVDCPGIKINMGRKNFLNGKGVRQCRHNIDTLI